MDAKRPLGQPKLPEGQRRDTRLDVMVRRAEAAELRKLAGEAGISLSLYLWQRIFERKDSHAAKR